MICSSCHKDVHPFPLIKLELITSDEHDGKSVLLCPACFVIEIDVIKQIVLKSVRLEKE